MMRWALSLFHDGLLDPTQYLVVFPDAAFLLPVQVRIRRVARSMALHPLTLVHAVVRPGVLADAVFQVVHVLSLVHHETVGRVPLHSAVAVELAIGELAIVLATVRPRLLPVAVPLVVLPLAGVLLRGRHPNATTMPPSTHQLAAECRSILINLLLVLLIFCIDLFRTFRIDRLGVLGRDGLASFLVDRHVCLRYKPIGQRQT
mmetsp:Transcript_36475/g.100450  ORF Transcript_36475/g.100450 Transcript_36475/m.100450 type:complete len:203 (+) Transcript_36475:182-790(+)